MLALAMFKQAAELAVDVANAAMPADYVLVLLASDRDNRPAKTGLDGCVGNE